MDCMTPVLICMCPGNLDEIKAEANAFLTAARERADNIVEVEVSERSNVRADEEVVSGAPIVANKYTHMSLL